MVTVQPIDVVLLLDIETVNEPSASTNPVTQLGFNELGRLVKPPQYCRFIRSLNRIITRSLRSNIISYVHTTIIKMMINR